MTTPPARSRRPATISPTSAIVMRRGGRHRRVEVAGRAAVPEVPDRVGPGRVDERDVGPERPLEDVRHAVDLALLLPFREVRPGADRREEPADAGSAGPDRLGERSLRQQLVSISPALTAGTASGFEVKNEQMPCGSAPAGGACRARDRLADVVRDDRQIRRGRLVHEGVDQRQRRTDEPEAADHDRVARLRPGRTASSAEIAACAVTSRLPSLAHVGSEGEGPRAALDGHPAELRELVHRGAGRRTAPSRCP